MPPVSHVQRTEVSAPGFGIRPTQTPMFAPEYSVALNGDGRVGAVYTKAWVVELMLDLAGYTADAGLVDSVAVEPAAGGGAFIAPMARRLVDSCRRQGRPLADCRDSLIAFELDESSLLTARDTVALALSDAGIAVDTARELARQWVRLGDYLFESFRLPAANFVIGNPPYVRLEDIPEGAASSYRSSYPSMTGRSDLYVGFYEAGLRQLKPGGVLAFICADRWMLNQYGTELRRLVTSGYSVETVIEMHEAGAFEDDVSAYPAITVLRRGPQRSAVVASAGPEAGASGGALLGRAVEDVRAGLRVTVAGLETAVVDSWFSGSEPWPCSSPGRLALLRRIEDQFGPLESTDGLTKVGIGVATGLDDAFITVDPELVEASRLLPLALARDTLSGSLQWSGHFLVDPWDSAGLVNLASYPRLKRYFERHKGALQKRHTAQKNSAAWYRTIDRVNHALKTRTKLYIPDIKDQLNPVLDMGQTYPHHNLYFIQSDIWEMEALGGILLSGVARLFMESYGVRMRGGYLRYQAQYLRRIRVPDPRRLSASAVDRLAAAFRARDRVAATDAALEIYGIHPTEWEMALGY
jgi:adenine-specific DNA-methyltransferase